MLNWCQPCYPSSFWGSGQEPQMVWEELGCRHGSRAALERQKRQERSGGKCVQNTLVLRCRHQGGLGVETDHGTAPHQALAAHTSWTILTAKAHSTDSTWFHTQRDWGSEKLNSAQEGRRLCIPKDTSFDLVSATHWACGVMKVTTFQSYEIFICEYL